MSKKHDDKQNIIIVGGGVGGAAIARSLSAVLDPAKYHLILINPRPYKIHLIASLRLMVSSQIITEDDIFVPYDKLFHNNNGEFILGSVASILQKPGELEGVVVLQSGESIPYHVLALTPGALWNGVTAFPDNADEVHDFVQDSQNKFKNANNIVLIGGGSVGLEISGEIKDLWPEKKVTVVHGDSQLLNNVYPDKFRRAAYNSFVSRGVEIVLNDRLDDETPVGGIVTTRNGKSLDADLVVRAFGSIPNTAFIATLSPDVLTEKGFVKVTPTLQLPSYPNIFSAGDVIEWKEQKQAAKVHRHSEVVTANIISYLEGGPLKPYKGSAEMIGITNGKYSGVIYIDLLWGIMLGGWITSLLKSRGLMISKHRSELGY